MYSSHCDNELGSSSLVYSLFACYITVENQIYEHRRMCLDLSLGSLLLAEPNEIGDAYLAVFCTTPPWAHINAISRLLQSRFAP